MGRGARARICNRLWSPGIDSEKSIPPAYVAFRAGTTNRVVVPASQAGNRFLGSLKGLQIWALTSWYPEDGEDGLVHSAHLEVLIAVLRHARSGGRSYKKERIFRLEPSCKIWRSVS